jgi:hypothetical protein
VTAETPRALLDPKTAARRLRRPLVGDSANPTDEYLALHLLNSAQHHPLEQLLTGPEANRRIGADLIALVRNRLRRRQDRERPPVEYSIPIPGPLWDRYAGRARDSHRRVSSVLVDALLRDDHRLCQGEEDALDARETFRSQARELIAQLVAARAALADHQARTQLDRERLQKLEAAVEDLGRHVATQGFALAALLTVLHDKGWVAKPLATALKGRGWLMD